VSAQERLLETAARRIRRFVQIWLKIKESTAKTPVEPITSANGRFCVFPGSNRFIPGFASARVFSRAIAAQSAHRDNAEWLLWSGSARNIAHGFRDRNTLASVTRQSNLLPGLHLASLQNPTVKTRTFRKAKAFDKLRIRHAPGQRATRNARIRRLESQRANLQDVANGNIGAGQAGNGQVFAKRAGGQFAPQFRLPPLIILAAIDINRLVGAAVMFCIANKITGQSIRADEYRASNRFFENTRLLGLSGRVKVCSLPILILTKFI
jgi:hypothetical protein